LRLVEEEREKYLRAGEAARCALSRALDMVEEGASLYRVAEELEGVIAKCGASPAFPVNISINSVAAHYSPGVGDQSVIPRGAVVKVDVGAHVDGCIADTALTISLDPRREPLVEAAKRALRAALAALKPGVELSEVGGSVESAVRAAGFKPVSNLSGHLMDKYTLHAGKHVPNARSEPCGKALAGEVYAVEPFVTDGAGYVVEAEGGTIYRLISTRGVGDAALDSAIKGLWSKYRGLPFSERWVFGEGGERALSLLKELVRLRRVYVYPPLVEAGGGFVAQFEDTVLLLPDRALNITRVLELLKK
jgi:methionyl aminopeptidase